MIEKHHLLARSILASAVALLLMSFSVHASGDNDRKTDPPNCRAEFRKCDPIHGACVWLGIPLDSACDKSCQIKLMQKIQKRIPTGIRSWAARAGRHGCVGFRTDLDGTENGAICLANHLGYRYDPVGRNTAGWAYNVIAE